jgi:hypothetical protein
MQARSIAGRQAQASQHAAGRSARSCRPRSLRRTFKRSDDALAPFRRGAMLQLCRGERAARDDGWHATAGAPPVGTALHAPLASPAAQLLRHHHV